MESSSIFSEVDLIEELRLRRWARENYVSAEERKKAWHPVVLEEMSNKDTDHSRSFAFQGSQA